MMLHPNFEIGVVDLENVFPVIKEKLIEEGPFQIFPKIDFRPDVGAPVFRPTFVSPPSSNCFITIFIISYRPKFKENDLLSIQKWQNQNPNSPFVTIILNQPPMTWGFTASRSKIEKKFQKFVPNGKTIIIKYISDSEHISSSDYQYLHNAIETTMASIVETQINELLQTRLNNNNFIRVNSELSNLLLSLGYHSASFNFGTKIRTVMNLKDFWPKKPLFHDIIQSNSNNLNNSSNKKKLPSNTPLNPSLNSSSAVNKDEHSSNGVIDCYDSGFDIIVSSLSHTFLCAKKSKFLNSQFADEMTEVFAIILNHCEDDDEKLFFARNFIQFTSNSFCDVIEKVDDQISATFAMISLSQTVSLIKMSSKINMNSEILTNLPEDRKNVESYESFLLSAWGMCRKIFSEWENHKKYFDSLSFNFLTSKNDKEGALQIFMKSEVLGTKKNEIFNYFESDVLLQLFEWKKDQNLAKSLISSSVPKDIKMEALKLLPEVYPMIPIHPKLLCPRFFTPLELFEHAQFNIQFSIPDFLIDENVKVYVIFKSQDHEMTSDISEINFNSHRNEQNLNNKLKENDDYLKRSNSFVLHSSVNCIYSGTFDQMILCIEFNSSKLLWNLPNNQPLTVNEYSYIPEITVKSPFLLSPNGEIQSAIILVENLDTECCEVGFNIEGENIKKIECNGENYEPNKEIVFAKFSSQVTFIVYLSYSGIEGISISYRYVRKDMKTRNISQSFEFPPIKEFQIRLYQQNQELQQFQIVNSFPIDFSFEFLVKTHKILPLSDYFILREKSEAPLELTFKEHGWENFPVTVTTSTFHLNHVTCEIKFDSENWEVGEPRMIEVVPCATPILENGNNDWVISSSDVSGSKHILVPTRPGFISFPQFLVNHQIADSQPDGTDIIAPDFPIYVPM
ncbi:hypothetical protein TRFO_28973 [Tritrichomonas foetus]|uniref:Uncharacterized protein n=1 Tax=Tritrichomonas foetus TaxID=1144522 RepID=A0A1J4JX85_9EUKA|nr:hypothetical protein TRFO_28973 [Tritrichomonas foetus]|eukprot:OHT03603.1 hypothetical protein TRFO_28973 [Tritrichomonas foetus]